MEKDTQLYRYISSYKIQPLFENSSKKKSQKHIDRFNSELDLKITLIRLPLPKVVFKKNSDIGVLYYTLARNIAILF